MKKRRVVILGSTGSIGESALKVARDIPERMEIVGLAAGKNVARLMEQAQEFSPKAIAIGDEAAAKLQIANHKSQTPLHVGEDGLCELATMPEADMVLISIVGTAGLRRLIFLLILLVMSHPTQTRRSATKRKSANRKIVPNQHCIFGQNNYQLRIPMDFRHYKINFM